MGILVPKPMLGRQLRKGHRLSQGLAGYWLFNEGSGNKVFDLSGNGNDLSLNSTVTWSTGKFGSVLDFRGGYLLNSAAKNLPTTVGSISVRIIIDDINSNQAFMELSDNSADNRIVFYIGSSKLYLYIKGDGVGANVWEKASSVLATGKLQHLVVTWNTVTDDYKIYLDGVLLTPDNTTVAGDPAGIDNINVGVFYDESSFLLSGVLDIPMIYNRALNASEIAELYHRPFAMFDRTPLELWVGATSVGVPPVGIPILRRRRVG